MTTVTLLTELLLALRANDPKELQNTAGDGPGRARAGCGGCADSGVPGVTAERGGSGSDGGLELGSEPLILSHSSDFETP